MFFALMAVKNIKISIILQEHRCYTSISESRDQTSNGNAVDAQESFNLGHLHDDRVWIDVLFLGKCREVRSVCA